jgi:flagellar biosynthesis protein FlgN
VSTRGKPDVIASLLAQELAALRVFIDLLRNEQTLLASTTSDGLGPLATDKSRSALELGQLSTARDQELNKLNLPTGRAGMDAWVISNAGIPYQRDWDRLLVLASEARVLNEANGKLIALHLQHNRQALTALLTAADQTATYGPDGQAKPSVGGRSLGSA